MRPAATLGIFALLAILFLGCDHGKDLLAKGAAAEAAGNFTDATAQYRAACDQGSTLCPIATRGIERIKLKEADDALSGGEYGKAKAAIDLAFASTDEGVKRTAEAMRKLPDLEKGVAWEEASASARPDEVRTTMESLAGDGFAVAPKAAAWLAKNRPRILLDRIKAACTPKGMGSCADLGRELARLHPQSPESADANTLVEADYARIFPLLQKAEGLMGQQAMIFVREEKVRWCVRDKTKQADQAADDFDYFKYQESQREPCESEVSPGGTPDEALAKALGKDIEEIHDPSFTKPLEERSKRAVEQGLFDPEPWSKPAGKK